MKLVHIFHFFLIWLTLSHSPFLLAESPGDYGLSYQKKNRFLIFASQAVLDGSIETSPPDATRIDRRLVSDIKAGAEGPFAGRFGYRLFLAGTSILKRETDDMEPESIADTKATVMSPLASLTFITDQGLELFAGIQLDSHGKKTYESASASGTSKRTTEPAVASAQHFGVIRRSGGAWAGGFYYVLGDETKQDVNVTAFDGSTLSATENIFIPSRFGVLGQFSEYNFALDFIQARGFGPTDDEGRTTMGDHFYARVGRTWPIGIFFEVSHRTLAYESNAYVTLDTIPVTSFKLASVTTGSVEEKIGVTLDYGHDGQSLPEFNATYDLKTVSLFYSGFFDF